MKRHPLDPASVDELHQAIALVLATGHVGARPQICSAALHEPPKDVVLAWGPDQPLPPRQVQVLVVDRATGVTMVLALLATLGIALMSAAVLQGISMRMNYLAYPRYVHVLEPWWLLTASSPRS